VLYEGWSSIDQLERTAGEPHGRPRAKLVTWEELLEAAESGRVPAS
jgi:NADPH-dependent glutamate synthase beta subunit-like oxidoreductase